MNLKRAVYYVITVLFLSGVSIDVHAQNTTVLPCDVSTPAEGNIFVGVEGSYPEMSTALKKINKVRLQACKEGLINPADKSKKLTMDDYVPLKWSTDLEQVSRLRAVESFVGGNDNYNHNRLNGSNIYISIPGCVTGEMETLAYEYGEEYKSGKDADGIDLWEWEKGFWEDGNTEDAGHYAAMINPKYRYVGISAFYSPEDGAISFAAQYATEQYDSNNNVKAVNQTRLAPVNSCIQIIEVKREYLSDVKIYKSAKDAGWLMKESYEKRVLVAGYSNQYYCAYDIVDEFVKSSGNLNKVLLLGDVSWESLTPSVASVSKDGTIKYKKKGNAVIQVSQNGNVICRTTLKIKYNAIGKASIKRLTKGNKSFTFTVNLKKNTWGYEVQWCKNKSFKGKTMDYMDYPKGIGMTNTVRRLKKGTYYVRVRGAKMIKGDLYYSAWSKIKKVKVK